MPAFDLRTVILMSSVMPGLMALVMFSLGRGFPANIRGVGHWASGALIVSLSAILLALRGGIGDWLSIVVANVGLILGTGLWLIGSQLFYGLHPSRRFVALLLVIGVIAMSWMTWVHPSVAGRTLCMSAILTATFGMNSLTMLRFGKGSNTAVYVGSMQLVQTVATAARGISMFVPAWASAGLFAPDFIQKIYLITSALMSLTVTVGLLFVAMDRLRNQLERQSFMDPLTGLLNRRAFLSAHQQEREKTMRTGGLLSLLLIDLDHFKQVNDTYGHATGDRILIDFAKRVADLLPAPGHVARWGGEEFAVLLPRVLPDEARDHAERIRQRVAQKDDATLPGYTCSIGVACMAASDATIEQLARDADEALYNAKRGGRNCVQLSDHVILI
ncbi:GGDEF domain-containing protein [Paraburkholderia hospita]|uniref:diguanylate cyclase n=1 Tax=Paraburkholderia hospita TaxID=169430 RepID=A0AAN1JJ23_9BURK|nr:GGDEF domain-containing protein [Paraburkholderia hospita]AUT74089.1 GGDEF domain-containing protein [Paraburkholderia hospita]EIN03001.1 diguanylate cyclase [Paraburkholderia hospita]OUL78146.1 GGDEF domain-containing protein [Paraburkholderia hospita]OUL83322.1 GGDEF domain-containing protein [Paraburkholderia hospita]SEH61499.1 diguanylate cyclase (GGDEF) domain-containing protein [Paraburkholderia hospita]